MKSFSRFGLLFALLSLFLSCKAQVSSSSTIEPAVQMVSDTTFVNIKRQQY